MTVTKNTQAILDWLYDVVGEQYVMCNVMYISGCIGKDITCSKCCLRKQDDKLQLEVVLPETTLTIDQDEFSDVEAKCNHFLEKEGCISITYKLDFMKRYEIHIIPVRRVAIPDFIIQCSTCWNNTEYINGL